MHTKFYKYQGTGNDFVMLDGRELKTEKLDVQKLCNRRFGIGADGLIILKLHVEYDFEMVYYNSDGNKSTMCGNGGRCAAQFAYDIGLVNKKNNIKFMAVDGTHLAEIHTNRVSLQMIDVSGITKNNNNFILNTGSPHYVSFINTMDNLNLIKEAKKIRYSSRFYKEGINVNFAKFNQKELTMRTYERGVEDETLSCGTGVTATALSFSILNNLAIGKHQIEVNTKGGRLSVVFNKGNDGFSNIWLQGAADKVFEGTFVSNNYLG